MTHPYFDTLTPKQRKAKQRELSKAYAAQSKLSCFTIGNLRTAKHKKQLQHSSAHSARSATYVADSGATVTIVKDINQLHLIEHWNPAPWRQSTCCEQTYGHGCRNWHCQIGHA